MQVPIIHGGVHWQSFLKYGHTKPIHPQLNPYKHREIKYAATQKVIPVEDTSPALYAAGVKIIQTIVGSLLYYARAFNNKLLVALCDTGSQQASAIEDTATDIKQLLDYVAIYQNDDIIYCASNMVLSYHADDSFHNDSKNRSRLGAHIFLSENDPG